MKLALKFLFLIILTTGISFAWHAKAAAPNAITNLNCVYSGIANSFTLTWSVPSGNPVSYDVRYAQSDISASDFNNAWQFWQNWSGSATEGQVNSLTQEKTWYFAMKAINNDGTSVISNVVYCYLPKAADNSDKTPPTSSITDPQYGGSILTGKDYIIKGTCSDSGGSSVQEVKISLDNGNTWQKVTPEESIGTGFNWEYVWLKPAVGSYIIKTRATDWWNNIETPKDGITAQVVSELPPTTEKPITEIAVEELKAKITEIQEKIIELLTQLIQLFRSQITQLQ